MKRFYATRYIIREYILLDEFVAKRNFIDGCVYGLLLSGVDETNFFQVFDMGILAEQVVEQVSKVGSSPVSDKVSSGFRVPYAAITIIFVIVATLVAAFVRRITRDKCLVGFEKNMVTLEKNDGKKIWGRLEVENTGIELVYPEVSNDDDGHIETSYIVYKHEYSHIVLLVRIVDKLDAGDVKRREREFKNAYHPGALRRSMRGLKNVFKTIRDSMMEVINVLISQAKKTGGAGAVVASQGKYVDQMKSDLVGAVGTSYEPLLEKYIGKRVVVEMVRGEQVVEYCGILKEYTASFIEIMDVEYRGVGGEECVKADLVVPRSLGLVRHFAESL